MATVFMKNEVINFFQVISVAGRMYFFLFHDILVKIITFLLSKSKYKTM